MVKGTNPTMRFVWTIGRLTLIDFTLFNIEEGVKEEPDVVVVHHYNDDEDKEGPDEDLFGKGK